MDDCLFCRIVEKKIPAKLVHEDPELMAFEDINPQAPVHLLIVPRRHIASLNDAAAGDAALLGGLMLMARRLARDRGIEGSGYRVVVNTMGGAGQSVFHVHLHLLGGRPMNWPPG
jgi:histidine triad (HIT) family protein